MSEGHARERFDRVSQWLAEFFVSHPNAWVSVEGLAQHCQTELGLHSELTWQRIAQSFVHNFTTHHMHHGRLLQKSTAATNGSSSEYIYALSYRVTEKGQADFAELYQFS